MDPTTFFLHPKLKDPWFIGERTEMLAPAQGRLLDLCFEPQANLNYYSPWVSSASVVCPDPAREPGRVEARNARGALCEQIFIGSGLKLPFADGEFDWAFSLMSLCRLPDPAPILAEIRRVLKPGGTYAFLEHGSSPDPRLRRCQWLANRMWQRFGGCELTRPIDAMIEESGFQIETLDRFPLPNPRVLAGGYRGKARV